MSFRFSKWKKSFKLVRTDFGGKEEATLYQKVSKIMCEEWQQETEPVRGDGRIAERVVASQGAQVDDAVPTTQRGTVL